MPSRRKMEEPAMQRLLDAVFANFARSNPSIPLTMEVKNKIEQRFRQLIPNLQTPSHPPYALMIHGAITELNEQRGSSEESISLFIKQEYDDLPWAHASYLSHYLEKLRQKGEIFVTRNKCYKLPVLSTVPKGEKVQKPKRGRGRGKKTSLEEENQSHELQSGVNVENEYKKQGLVLRFVCKQKRDTETSEDVNKSKWLRIELIDKQEKLHDRYREIEAEINQQQDEIKDFDKENWPMGSKTEMFMIEKHSRKQQDEADIEKNWFEEQHTELNDEQDESWADEKFKVNEGVEELEDSKSQEIDETELFGQQRSNAVPSSHDNDDYLGSGVDNQVSLTVIFGEPLEPLKKLIEETSQLHNENVWAITDISQPCDDGIEHDQQPKDNDPISQQEKMLTLYDVPTVSSTIEHDPQPVDADPITFKHSSQTLHNRRLPHILRHLEWSMEIKPSMEETSQSLKHQSRTRYQRKHILSNTMGLSLDPQLSEQSLHQEFSNQERSLVVVQNQETGMESSMRLQHQKRGRGRPKGKTDKGTTKGVVFKRAKYK